MNRKFMTEELKKSLGTTCVCCGSEEGIEYHHIVPLALGGTNTPTNIVPLCHSCHMAAHYGRNLSEYKRLNGCNSGRHFKRSDEDAFEAFDLLAEGKIGTAKCHEMLGAAKSVKIKDMPQYRKWREARGIRDTRSNYDVVAVISPKKLIAGAKVGYIVYEDGCKEDIVYQQSDINDTVYTFKNNYPKPMNLNDYRVWLEAEIARKNDLFRQAGYV